MRKPHEYTWQPPKFRVDQIVSFMWSEHIIRVGRIFNLETHYNLDGTACHVYRIIADGHKVGRSATEKDMWS